MFSMALMAKGNESYINIGAVKLREMKPNASRRETSPNKYWKNQAKGSNYKPRSNLFGSRRPREMNSNIFVSSGSAKRALIKFVETSPRES